jgi:hypothetical protein
MANLDVLIWQEAWENKLAQRLNKSQNWKEVCDVRYTDTKVLNMPYISPSNEPAVSTTFFTAAADRTDVSKVIPFIGATMANESLNIISTTLDSVYMDYGDQAQSQYVDWAGFGDLLGKKLNERIESVVLGNGSNWTNFGSDGAGGVGLYSAAITVTATNVAQIIRGVIEQIITANGYEMYKEKGGFIVWRPADWTLVTQYMQANGFYQADLALKNGGGDAGGVELVGVPYMGLFHYVSTLYTAGSLMAGVRGTQVLGILKTTYGRTYRAEMPASSTAGSLSGTQIHSRVDYGMLVQTNMKPIIYNVNVA